ncbi:fungal-specific transcription factor domain-containing protein [Plectosphaerella plurivora]|uniref:Fungal-specific transcription factor domain-containing protein n=1 Tax=Plectosphaerella plurivora TaxID=936078 RepID=A0A9P8VHN5_9PEZI|nr:fungal-specific transcription factor domain-containing protein [Plectosphaerella plurivora]
MPGSDPSPDSDLAGEHDAVSNQQPTTEAAGPRIKCDGKQPCYNCSSRNQDCEVTQTNDNASASRNYAASFEVRCQQMAALCERLETLTGQLANSIDALSTYNSSAPAAGSVVDDAHADLMQAAHVLRSMPELRRHVPPEDAQVHLTTHPVVAVRNTGLLSDLENDEQDSASDILEQEFPAPNEQDTGGVGALVRDSYGDLRFVGGSSNHMLIEAAHSASPNTTGPSPLFTDPGGSSTAREDREQVDIPIFVRGKTWPQLPFLPRPDQLPKPPQYVADLLTRLFFDQLHYTFPVLFKPRFMQGYRRMYGRTTAAGAEADDRRFLMVFFAVCACASSLLPPTTDPGFPGLEYYERALLLYYASTGEASLERVQCLSLLSMCAAGWNTPTQSWTLAGQAVRAAQDIGLHLHSRLILSSQSATRHFSRSGPLEQQISRRVWWCVYILDRTTSLCLGRPTAAHDDDCDWEMPIDLSDEVLERYFSSTGGRPPSSHSPSTTGFLAFARLCCIAGRIQQLGSARRLRDLTSAVPGRPERFLARVSAYDGALQRWLDSLPDSIRFSANTVTAENNGSGGEDLVMCVVSFIVHAGSLLNLHRFLVGQSGPDPSASIAQCKSAAKSCINAAEMVRDLVPPSHYLAICVHYLTLSGVVLLRLPPENTQADVIADVERCAGFLKHLEQRWSGAARSRAIVEKLLADYRDAAASGRSGSHRVGFPQGALSGQNLASSGKRTFTVFDEQTPSLELGGDVFDLNMNSMLGFELFQFDGAEPGLLGPWGRS